MSKKNPNPPPCVCPSCGTLLLKVGQRITEEWPEEEGKLYKVEIYACQKQACPYSKTSLEYCPELPD